MCNTENVWKIICSKQISRTLTKQELIKAKAVGWKQLVKGKMAEYKKIKCKTVTINNNNKKLSERNGIKIEFIRNVKSNVIPDKQKKSEINENQQKANGKIDLKRNNLKPKVFLESGKNAANNISNCKKDLVKNAKPDTKKIIKNCIARNGSLTNVKSNIILENKMTSEIKKFNGKKIQSVTDVLNAVSLTTRIKSCNVIRNK